jgi:hypothetical protein
MEKKVYIVNVSTGCTCCPPVVEVAATSKAQAMEQAVRFGIPLSAQTRAELKAEQYGEFTPEI